MIDKKHIEQAREFLEHVRHIALSTVNVNGRILKEGRIEIAPGDLVQ